MSKNLRKLNVKTQTHQHWLDVMSQSQYVKEKADGYNQGPLIDKLEHRVAKLLGKEKALFFHKGIAAQLVALKVVAESKNNNKVILHPNSHIAGDENNAYQVLMGLRGIELG
ncbi:MAG: beta-eliminating lyase-related protein, partial [Bacteroidota bacterium]